MAYFIPNELKKKKESRLNYDAKQVDKMMICIQHKEAAQPPLEKMLSSMICLNDEQQQEYDEEEYDEEEEEDDEEDRSLMALLLPRPPFIFIHNNNNSPIQSLLVSPPQRMDILTIPLLPPVLFMSCPLLLSTTMAFSGPTTAFLTNNTINKLSLRPPKRTTPNAPSSWTHASRASAVVNMEHTHLVDCLTTDYKWAKLFPSRVSEALSLRFLFQGSSSRNPDGSLQLIYTELQATTPLLPKRAFALLRTCKQIDHLTWVVADIPIDRLRNVGFLSGCLIQGIADGFSQVIWVEHLEVEENYLDRKLYTDLTSRGFGFGAERWVACLERSCERRSYQAKTDILVPCLLGQDPFQLFNEKLAKTCFFNSQKQSSCLLAPELW